MKKRFWVIAAIGILVVALAAPAAFGAISGIGQNAPNQQFVNQMFDWHQQWLDQAQKDGQVTPEQAKVWQDHFNYMREFHNQNGFGPMGSMMGGGGMMGSGMMGNGSNGMMGTVNGMMGGYGTNNGGYGNTNMMAQ